VYRRSVDAGFVRESALDVLREEIDLSRIRVVARTSYIANWPFAAAPNADGKLVESVRERLTALKDKSILSAAGLVAFKAATDRDFDDLRKRIGNHESK
jgi:ABC-type phosphate/phosphonate transport system substrate-binding protein